ncbi:MAG: hypothetical protein Q9181_002971 [Wetmoreana brouardii]
MSERRVPSQTPSESGLWSDVGDMLSEKDPREDQYCFAGCQQALAGQTFAGFPSIEDSYDAESCENSLHVQSVLLWTQAYCTSHQIYVGFKYASGHCEAGGYGFPNLSVVDNVTTKGIQQMKTLEYGDAPDIINTAVIPSRELLKLGERTVVNLEPLCKRHGTILIDQQMWWYGGRRSHLWYSVNLLTYLRADRSSNGDRPLGGRSTIQRATPVKRFWAQTRALFLLPATFGHICCEPKWYGSIPPRAESVIICVYLALNVTLCAFLGRSGMTEATVDFSEEDQMIRIDVSDIFCPRRTSGGVHFFLYSPLTGFGWQSHPFTLVRWIEFRQDGINRVSSATKSASTLEHGMGEKLIAEVSACQASGTLEGPTRYSFLVRPRNGYTARLRASLGSPLDSIRTRLLYEGPYGHVAELQRYSNILLFVGGSGTSVGISHIYNALERNADAILNLVWTCRRPGSCIESIMQKELRYALEIGRLTVDAFVTGAAEDVPERWFRKGVRGRPDVCAFIYKAAMDRRGPLAVVACGPPSLADDARAAFVSELRKGPNGMELFI